MEKYKNLIRAYKEQTTDEILLALLNVSLLSLENNEIPTTARIKFSLLMNSPTLLDETVDFNDLEFIKAAKCKEIDSATATAIVDLVGDDVKQRNLTAKAVQLTLKVVQGTTAIGDEELLTHLNSLFTQVEKLRADGNSAEAAIMATSTVDEFENVCKTLNI